MSITLYCNLTRSITAGDMKILVDSLGVNFSTIQRQCDKFIMQFDDSEIRFGTELPGYLCKLPDGNCALYELSNEVIILPVDDMREYHHYNNGVTIYLKNVSEHIQELIVTEMSNWDTIYNVAATMERRNLKTETVCQHNCFMGFNYAKERDKYSRDGQFRCYNCKILQPPCDNTTMGKYKLTEFERTLKTYVNGHASQCAECIRRKNLSTQSIAIDGKPIVPVKHLYRPKNSKSHCWIECPTCSTLTVHISPPSTKLNWGKVKCEGIGCDGYHLTASNNIIIYSKYDTFADAVNPILDSSRMII